MPPDRLGLVLSLILVAGPARAGLLPSEVMVIGAEAPSESADLARSYQSARGLPEANICLLEGPFPEVLSQSDYNELFWPAVKACLGEKPIGALVTVKGLPVRIGAYSLEALLAIGDSEQGGERLREASQRNRGWLLNPFYGLAPYEGIRKFARGQLPQGFRPGDGAAHELDYRLTSRLDGFTFDQARGLIDRSLASDGEPPDGDWLCMRGSDTPRAIRDDECYEMLDLLDELAWVDTLRLDFDRQLSGHRLAGYFTGTAGLKEGIAGNEYPPGAIADNITSYMGVPGNFGTGQSCEADDECPQDGNELCIEGVCLRESQTSIARFIAAGITGAHATAAEPYNNTFPSALVMPLYLSGYSLAESFHFSIPFLTWVNVVYGDPLAAPYAKPTVLDLPERLDLDQDAALLVELQAQADWWISEVQILAGDEIVFQEMMGRSDQAPLVVWDHDLALGSHELRMRVFSQPLGLPLGPSFSAGLIQPQPQVVSEQRFQLNIIEAKPPDPPDKPPSPEPPPPSDGCHCQSASGWPGAWLLLLAFLAKRRRFQANILAAAGPLDDDTGRILES